MAWLFAVIGGSATIRLYEESFFVGNPFEGPGWTGGPGTISLVPEALSVRLGFSQNINLLMKDFFQKRSNDKSIYYIAV